MNERVFVINPGSTGTKVALYENGILQWNGNVLRPDKTRYPGYVKDEVGPRLAQLRELLREKGVTSLDAVVGRGGLLRPVPGGTYAVNDTMVEDALEARRGEHASNLGCVLAREIARMFSAKAYIVDPVSTDELSDLARVSGFDDLPRQSLAHYLSIKSVYRLACEEMNIAGARVVVVHLGSGITVAAVDNGRVIDTTNANDEGPFSPERSGEVPTGDLVRLCFSGQFTKTELTSRIVSQSGLKGYLGTADAREIEQRIASGDEKAKLVYDAMIYQIGKEIGAMSTVLCGRVDAVVLTGGLANSRYVTDHLIDMVKFIAPVMVYPGEREMDAMAQGALRVLRQEEPAKEYPKGGVTQ